MVETPPCIPGDVGVIHGGRDLRSHMTWGAAKPKCSNKRSPCPATKTQGSQKKKSKQQNKAAVTAPRSQARSRVDPSEF